MTRQGEAAGSCYCISILHFGPWILLPHETGICIRHSAINIVGVAGLKAVVLCILAKECTTRWAGHGVLDPEAFTLGCVDHAVRGKGVATWALLSCCMLNAKLEFK